MKNDVPPGRSPTAAQLLSSGRIAQLVRTGG